jgi:excisionase family DNA binding protein
MPDTTTKPSRIKKKPLAEPRRAYSRNEVADLLGISFSTVRRRIGDGTLPAARIGSRVVIPAQAVDALLVTKPAAERAA